jgi:hypothetical protein
VQRFIPIEEFLAKDDQPIVFILKLIVTLVEFDLTPWEITMPQKKTGKKKTEPAAVSVAA